MSPEKEFDIIICGAGPAGVTCALALADSGLRVAVLEKHSFPRDKVCGDAVAAYVPDVLGTINPKFKLAVSNFSDRVNVHTCRVVAPNGKHIDIGYQKEGFIAKRFDWDNFLFELAANESRHSFFTNEAIVSISYVGSRWHVKTSANNGFTARLLVGCDGAHSQLARHVGIHVDHDHHAGAVRAYFENVSGTPGKTFELHFIKGYLPGYFWIFPLSGNLSNVGLGLLSREVSNRGLSLRDGLSEIIRNTPSIADRFIAAKMIGKVEGFGLPLGSRKLSISGEGYMLCGDAASLIDPLSGEGIGQAIVSGRYAGWHAAECFRQNNFSAPFMKTYDEQVYKKFWRRHRLNHSIQKIIAGRAWLFNAIFNAASGNSLVKRALIKTFA